MCTIIPYSSNIITCNITKTCDEIFIADMENVYQTENIYRGIVVTNTNKQKDIQDILESYNHTTQIIDTINDNLNLEILDCRIIIVDFVFFKELIDHIHNKYDLTKSSYNFIGITYDIDSNIKDNLIAYLNTLTNYRNENTIII